MTAQSRLAGSISRAGADRYGVATSGKFEEEAGLVSEPDSGETRHAAASLIVPFRRRGRGMRARPPSVRRWIDTALPAGCTRALVNSAHSVQLMRPWYSILDLTRCPNTHTRTDGLHIRGPPGYGNPCCWGFGSILFLSNLGESVRTREW